MVFSQTKAHRMGLIIVGLVAAVLMVVFFPGVIRHPDNYFFLDAGDGIEAYFATTYNVLYDKGLHFSGMNYPFGEHVNYPNLQPLLSLGLRQLTNLGVPLTAPAIVGITNLVALLGLALTPVVLYAILRRTRLPVWYSVVLAIIIGFLSPQIDRLGGHMSLSYPCFVPFIWYCLIRIQEAPLRWRWYVILAVSSLLMAGTSVYFLACASFFALAHALVLSWQLRRPWPVLWRLALTALLPLLAFRSWLWLTDPIADRPENPYGFLEYLASPTSVFTPILSPGRELWQALFHTEPANSEGWSYVGLVAGAVAVVGLVRVAGHLARRRWGRVLRPVLPLHLQSGLWAAVLLLLLAFGWPFKFAAFEWLLAYVGPLKQFRALGRFAWPFFYVFSTYAAYYLYQLWRYLRQHGVPRFATSWLAALLLLWAGESFLQIHAKAKEIAGRTGAVDFMTAEKDAAFRELSWSNRQVSDFQAILPLPYFSIGTDKIDISGSERGIYEAFRLSMVSGLPLVATHMTRSSVGQILSNLQLLSSPLVAKNLASHFPSRKPLLLLVMNDALTPAEQRLVGLARKLATTPDLSLYELPLDSLAATTVPAARARATSLLPTLAAQPGGVRTSTGLGAIVQAYGQSPDQRGRLGAGAFYEPKSTFSTLYDGPLPTPADTGRYEAAVWRYGKTAYGYGNMQVSLYDASGQMLDHQVADARQAMEVQDDWVRVAVPFRRTPQATRMVVLYDNRDLLADDLLIRPLNTDVYWFDPRGGLVLNGYSLAPKK